MTTFTHPFMLAALLLATVTTRAEDGVPFPGPTISATTVRNLTLGNNTLTAAFFRDGGSLRLASLQSPLNGLDLAWGDPNLFTIYLSGSNKPLASSALKLTRGPEAVEVQGNSGAARLSDRLYGRGLRAWFTDEATGLAVQWTAVMTDGANYLRQELVLSATRGRVSVDRIEMIHASLPGAQVAGYTDGSPLTTDKLFLGIEHPMAQNLVKTHDAWTPAEMRARKFDVPLTGLKPGELKVQFNYQHGNHRIDVAGVSLVDEGGRKLAGDIHAGFSGGATHDNVYRLTVPAGTANATLQFELGGLVADTDSWGKIAVTGAQVADADTVISSLPRQCPLEPGATWTVASGIGVYPAGQLRRAFLHYLERERAHPYRQYWHYNSWYDLNIGNSDNPDPLKRMTEAQCMEVIRAFDRELHEKSGTGLDGFVWDDGWSDWNSLWDFATVFPNGFTKLQEEAAKQGAGMGAWLSPWGGYGYSQQMRVKYGREHGYETNPNGYSLGGPKYYAAFRDVCLKMIHDYKMNYFKFDGIGGGMYATGAPASIAPDLDCLVRLLGELRRANPEVFINCTVGTWASPYWAWFADSVWRQGEDCAYAGEGNARERWITYRDERVYSRFAHPSPLYPLNSMMYHGLLVSPRATPGAMPTPAKDFNSYRNELLMSVACGSGLGELYVTPSLMTPEAWNLLAMGLKWTRAHRDILRDTHWIGGNPLKEIYGYAAWHPKLGGTLVLRNPTAREQTFMLDPQKVFELPSGAVPFDRFAPALNSPIETVHASAGKPATLVSGLEPKALRADCGTNERTLFQGRRPDRRRPTGERIRQGSYLAHSVAQEDRRRGGHPRAVLFRDRQQPLSLRARRGHPAARRLSLSRLAAARPHRLLSLPGRRLGRHARHGRSAL